MKYVIGLLLVLLNVFLGYTLYKNIQEPIQFQEVKSKKGLDVIEKLEDIRKAQEIYRKITGKFAGSFDSLRYVLQNDSIPTIKQEVIAGTQDEFNEIRTYSPAIDSIRSLGIELNDIEYVPHSDRKKFAIQADTLTYQQTLVNVVEVGTRWKEFMGQYGDIKYAKYDNSYDPNTIIKFGDMNVPNLAGNWEK